MNLGFNIITREDLFADRKTYLWKDILTLRCRVGKYSPQTRHNCYNVFRTRNCIQTSNIHLPIESFQNASKSNPEVLHISTTKENDLLTLNAYMGKDEVFEGDPEENVAVKDGGTAFNSLVHIDIERSKRLKTPIYPMYVFCRVKFSVSGHPSLKNSSKNMQVQRKHLMVRILRVAKMTKNAS
ncbi:hypothetical protein TNCV_1015701 [Trichonephila clavipes]|uniref:Uncharacterized protein n=1 Tax=Trichonephila clavipes TaxID=2585209 RepID=A0A8X6VY04_TRICX|nr:hypothetical protein TNCV_1015701 [Trichonephila clavipes]